MRVIVLALFCCAAASAAADTRWSAFNGNRLLQACESESALCEGYILGVVDARYTEGTFCVSRETSTAQIVETVKRYLGDRPELGHVAASSLVGDALAETFPCR